MKVEKHPDFPDMDMVERHQASPLKVKPSLEDIADLSKPKKIIGSSLTELIEKMFLWKGRFPNHERVLCLFPFYMQTYHDLTYELLVEKEVLPVPFKYFLAIMAVSCYNCEYLRNLMEEQFILMGGDPAWVEVGI
jgi:hypothetical protein